MAAMSLECLLAAELFACLLFPGGMIAFLWSERTAFVLAGVGCLMWGVLFEVLGAVVRAGNLPDIQPEVGSELWAVTFVGLHVFGAVSLVLGAFALCGGIYEFTRASREATPTTPDGR